MHVTSKMKLNKFSYTPVPSASALFALRGARPSTGEGLESNEQFDIPVNRLGNKLETLALGEQIAIAAKDAANGNNPDHNRLNLDPTKL